MGERVEVRGEVRLWFDLNPEGYKIDKVER